MALAIPRTPGPQAAPPERPVGPSAQNLVATRLGGGGDTAGLETGSPQRTVAFRSTRHGCEAKQHNQLFRMS